MAMSISMKHQQLIDAELELESSGPIAPAPSHRAPPPPPPHMIDEPLNSPTIDYLDVNMEQGDDAEKTAIMQDTVMNYVTETVINAKQTLVKPGSIIYLLYGDIPSKQSIQIKMGKVGEFIVKTIVNMSQHLELLQCGVQDIGGKRKDVDLIWCDKLNKTIYYREAKGNAELDTEKLPATIKKVQEIRDNLVPKYPGYKFDAGLFNWSVYNREIITSSLSHIKKCEDKGLIVDHMGDMMKILDFKWSEKEFYEFFAKIGEQL